MEDCIYETLAIVLRCRHIVKTFIAFRQPQLAHRLGEVLFAKFLHGKENVSTGAEPGRLTPREREIVQQLDEGKSDKEEAAALGIFIKTAETHSSNVLLNFGALRSTPRRRCPSVPNQHESNFLPPSRPHADLRWKELGYSGHSAYVTGLIRYDLLIGGPHLFSGRDTRREILAALDRETRESRNHRHRRKLFLDHLIERVQGQALSEKDLEH